MSNPNESKIRQFLQRELDFRIATLPILKSGDDDQIKDDIEQTNDEILLLEDIIDIVAHYFFNREEDPFDEGREF